ncbi:MAG: HAD family hydrolase [candidate division WOR-3 bacterium]|jgi:phosphoglycolate phosphatase
MKLLIFDFDGTLFDTSIGLTQAINELLKKQNKEPLSREQVKKIVGGGIEATLREIFKEDFKSELIEEFNEIYRKYMFEGLVVYTNVIETLKKIKEELNCKLVIYSNKSKFFIIEILRRFDIYNMFDEIITIDDGFKKPDRKPIDYLIEKYNISRENVYIIGDSCYDVETARISNVKSIFVKWGFGENCNADFVVNEPSEIYNIIIST